MNTNYGKLLQLLRARYSLTQSELEGKADMVTGALTEIENGHRDPKISELQACATIFGVKMSSLIEAAEELADEQVILPSLVSEKKIKLKGRGSTPKNKRPSTL